MAEKAAKETEKAAKEKEAAPSERSQEIGLHNLRPKPGSRRPRKRIGRGEGRAAARPPAAATRATARARARSGRPATRAARTRSTCGCESCAARTKRQSMPFENFRTKTQPVNLSDLEDRFDAGAEVNPETLKEKGLAKRSDPVKILARGEISKKLTSTRTASAPPPRRRSRRRAVPATLWSADAQDHCERLQRRRHSQEARLHGGDAAALPAGRLHPRAGGRPRRRQGTAEQLRRLRHPRLPQPLLGRQPLAPLALRAGDHALHHRLDHPAAADRGRALAGEAAERRRGRPAEDHPVHALPDRRPGLRPVLRLRLPLQVLRRAKPAAAT